MEDYIDVLLNYIADERLTTRTNESTAHLAREESACEALTRTFTAEQHDLFHTYDIARSACASDSESAYARAAFLLAKEIFS